MQASRKRHNLVPEVFLDFSPHEMRKPEPRCGERESRSLLGGSGSLISSCWETSRKTSGTRVKEAAQEDLVLKKLVYHSTEFWDRKHSRTLRVIFSLDVVSHENICAYNFVVRTFELKMENWELYNWSKLVITIASEVIVGWLYRRNPRKVKQLSVGFDHQIIFYPEN